MRRQAHLDPLPRALRDLPDSTVEDLREYDGFGHYTPEVQLCTVEVSTVTFDEIVTIESGVPRLHTYGVASVRYSSFRVATGKLRPPSSSR